MSKLAKTFKKLAGVRRQRVRRVRSVVSGTAVRPRLVVQRSLRYFRAQLIDDVSGKTVVAIDSRTVSKERGIAQAVAVGKALAEKAGTAGITVVVFDRRHYRYHGRVKAFAEAVREAGLNF